MKWLPVADPLVVNTFIVISYDDGLLSIIVSNTGPSCSLTLYVGCPKLTAGATNKDTLLMHISSYKMEEI